MRINNEEINKHYLFLARALFYPFFLSFFVWFLISCSLELFVDVPLIFFCPADRVLTDWQPRILLGIVEARSVNVKNTTTSVPRPTIERIMLILYF